MRVCAVIPAYNEEGHIAEVVRRTLAQVDTVLVVDDGSPDRTALFAREAGAEVIQHNPNQGKGASLADGFAWAQGQGFDAVVALDGDGQHAPEEIPRFLEAAGEAEMVIGNRMDARRDMPLVRWWTNRSMSAIISWLAGTTIPDSQNGFRLIQLGAWKQLDVRSRNFEFESEMLVMAGRAKMRIVSVPVSTIYADEVSHIRPGRDTLRFFGMIWRLLRRRPTPPVSE